MATEFYVPKMSDHMEEGIFVEWLVEEGDSVDKGQPILVIDTDKAEAEVEAPASGFLTGIRQGLSDGVSIAIGETVAFIVADLSEEVPVLDPLGTPSPNLTSVAKTEQTNDLPVVDSAVATVGPTTGGPVRATPAARSAARELGLDLSDVSGSGPDGRVSESDVRGQAGGTTPPGSRTPETNEAEWLDLTPAQTVTARRMVASITEVPQFSVTKPLDLTAVIAARAASAVQPSVTAFLVRAVASALADHPRVNGFYREGRIQINPNINVGVAMATPLGLYVPVIHHADRLTVEEISDHLKHLQGLANGAGFSIADLEGGTFTLSNLGMHEVEEFRAIVNPPQAAILATGRVAKGTVVNSDEVIGVRDLMKATITADHRSLDGVAAAQFLASISAYIEQIGPGGDATH